MHSSSSSSSTQRRRKRGKQEDSISTDSSSSSSIIDSNLDILILILTRLPLQSVLVSKSVSKQWFSLIHEPHFIHSYTLQNPNSSIPAGLLWTNRFSLNSENDYISLDGRQQITCSAAAPFRTLTFDDGDEEKLESEEDVVHYKIIQSCNGLLLCSTCTYDNWNRRYYIFNPFTNKHRILPRSQLRKRGFTILWSVGLAFDPMKSPYYKVVCLWFKHRSTSAEECRIEIYSSKSSEWKLCGEEYSAPTNLMPYMSAVYWNGSLNWICKQGSLFYFDIGREVTAEVVRHLPDNGNKWKADYRIDCFDTYESHLRLIEVSPKASTLNVFHMDIGYTGWNLKFRVDLERLEDSYPRPPRYGYIVLYVVEGEKSAKSVILIRYHEVISYDPRDNISKLLYIATGSNTDVQQFYFGPSYNVYKYVESLAHV